MRRLVCKSWILGSCCVAALMAVGCQTGTGTRSQRPMAKNGGSSNAFSSKEALAAQRTPQPINASQSPLLGSNPAQFPVGMSAPGGSTMGGMNTGGMNTGGMNTGGMNTGGMNSNSMLTGSSPSNVGTLGGTPTGVMPASFNSPLPTTGALPPPGTELPRNSPTSTNFGSSPSTLPRSTASPAPGGFEGMGIQPPPMPPPSSFR